MKSFRVTVFVFMSFVKVTDFLLKKQEFSPQQRLSHREHAQCGHLS